MALIWVLVIMLGLLSSWHDIKNGRIPNALTAPFFLAGFLFSFWGLGFTDLFITFLAAFFLSFLFWKLTWWYGGDAKLFLAYAMILPQQQHLLPVVLLTNTILPLAVFYFLILVAKSRLFFLPLFVRALVTVFAVSWIQPFFGPMPALLFFPFLYLLAYAFSFLPFSVVISLSVFRLLSDYSIYHPLFFSSFFSWTVVYVGINCFIQWNADIFVSRGKVREGHLLAEERTLHGQKIAKDTLVNAAQARLLGNALVYETIPFAPALFLGAVLTLFGLKFI